jgi:hypothetical protein
MAHAHAAPRVDCVQRCQVSAQYNCVIDGFQKGVFCCSCCSVQNRCAQIAGIKEGDLDRFGGDTEDDYSLAAWLDKGPDVNAKKAELALSHHMKLNPPPSHSLPVVTLYCTWRQSRVAPPRWRCFSIVTIMPTRRTKSAFQSLSRICCHRLVILFSGTRPMHWDAHRDRVVIAGMLLDERADVNARDNGCACLLKPMPSAFGI